MNEYPHVVELDMGGFNPPKFAIWWPFPVYRTKNGRLYHIHPKQRFTTQNAAEKELLRKRQSYNI